MKSDVFKLIYNHPLLKSENYEEIKIAHTRIEISQNEQRNRASAAHWYTLILKKLIQS